MYRSIERNHYNRELSVAGGLGASSPRHTIYQPQCRISRPLYSAVRSVGESVDDRNALCNHIHCGNKTFSIIIF